MSMHIDTAYRSLNKYGEELCGDTVQVVKTSNSTIAVLADGLGSGVKANILSTLSSTIISTMLQEGATVEQAVETLVSTLPVCSVRKMAYSTFSILQISDEGDGYLVEFDNPFCIFIRDGKPVELPCEYREYAGKGVYETRFRVRHGDVLALISDGVVYAGVGATLNFGWTRDSVQSWLCNACKGKDTSAPRLAANLSQAVDELYMGKPGDDSTVLIVKAEPQSTVNILSGPPKSKEDDIRMVRDFMRSSGKKVVCGGTSANIVSRVLNRKITTSIHYVDPMIPPTASIDGIDLVAEGVLTLTKTAEILKDYSTQGANSYYFYKLDEQNGASMLAKLLLENCTELRLFIGTAINPAHQNPNLPSDLSIKIKLIQEIAQWMENLGRRVEITYY